MLAQAIYTLPDPLHMAYGLLTGLVFGFLLQKGGVTKYRVIVGQFLLRDFTVLRVMVTAVIVGAVGVWFLFAQDWGVEDHLKATQLLAQAAGGAIFGIGMAILGYCPGTAIGALGDRSRHVIAGILGMLAGAALYAEAHPWAKDNVLPLGDWGKVTLPSLTGWSPWIFIALFALLAFVVFFIVRKFDRPIPEERGDPRQR